MLSRHLRILSGCRAGFGVPTLQRDTLRCEGWVRNQAGRTRWRQWRQQEARPLVPNQIALLPARVPAERWAEQSGVAHGPWARDSVEGRGEGGGHLAQETSEPSHPIRSGGPQTPGSLADVVRSSSSRSCSLKVFLGQLSPVAAQASLIIHRPGGQVGRGEALPGPKPPGSRVPWRRAGHAVGWGRS